MPIRNEFPSRCSADRVRESLHRETFAQLRRVVQFLSNITGGTLRDMRLGLLGRVGAALALALVTIVPVQARDGWLKSQFDSAFGTQVRAPRDFAEGVVAAPVNTALEQQLAQLAAGTNGRIGVAALDLTSGEEVAILGDQRFPMASTSKIAIVATFMAGVEQGRWTLDSEFPLRVPVRSKPFSSAVAPTRAGSVPERARADRAGHHPQLEQPAADGLLAAVGGPRRGQALVHHAGIREFNLTRTSPRWCATTGRSIRPTRSTCATAPRRARWSSWSSGIYQGSCSARRAARCCVGAMERCRTGKTAPQGAAAERCGGGPQDRHAQQHLQRRGHRHRARRARDRDGDLRHRQRRQRRYARQDRHLARAVYDGYLQAPPGRQSASATYPRRAAKPR